jgi:hypothetical protein
MKTNLKMVRREAQKATAEKRGGSISVRRVQVVPLMEWVEDQGFALAIMARTDTQCFSAFALGVL